MKDSLRVLRIRLLLEALDRVPNSEWHGILIQEAQTACAQAESTHFPELVLPCLFEERAGLALKLAKQRDLGYWRRIVPFEPRLVPGTESSLYP